MTALDWVLFFVLELELSLLSNVCVLSPRWPLVGYDRENFVLLVCGSGV